MFGKTPIEKLIDRLLLLYLIYDATRYQWFEETYVQKLVFFSEWEMLDACQKGLTATSFA